MLFVTFHRVPQVAGSYLDFTRSEDEHMQFHFCQLHAIIYTTCSLRFLLRSVAICAPLCSKTDSNINVDLLFPSLVMKISAEALANKRYETMRKSFEQSLATFAYWLSGQPIMLLAFKPKKIVVCANVSEDPRQHIYFSSKFRVS